MNNNNRPSWSSGPAFILAAVGAAVGLGNIWKFPYIVGVSGGGAFVVVYLLCVLVVILPILLGEILIGRMGSHSPPRAMRAVAERFGGSRWWSLVGFMGIAAAFLIGTFYSVIAGWTLVYTLKAAAAFDGAAAYEVGEQFDRLLTSPGSMTLWHSLFMLATILIVGQGLQNGIERTVKALMPALAVMLLVMIGYAVVAGDMPAAVDFLFRPHFEQLTGEVVIAGVGQAFFSIGVASGLMMAYGAYIPASVSLPRSALIIVLADTAVALLAGLIIFPFVFAYGLDPGEGPGLIYKTLPGVFVQMPGGRLFGTLFFLLLAFAAITTMIGTLVGVVAYAGERWSLSRWRATMLFGFIAWFIGLGTVFSFNILAGFHPLDAIPPLAGKTIFELIDYFVSNLLMPIGGVLIAVFVGWRMHRDAVRDELRFDNDIFFRAWRFLVRYLVPVSIVLVLLKGLAIF